MKKVTAMLSVVIAFGAGPAFADGDAEAGESVFRKCRACHQVGPEGQNRVGPALNAIVGAQIGVQPDFRYSDVFAGMTAEGAVWTDEALTEFLKSPRDFAPRTKMTFGGLRNDEDIADVIAYLAAN